MGQKFHSNQDAISALEYHYSLKLCHEGCAYYRGDKEVLEHGFCYDELTADICDYLRRFDDAPKKLIASFEHCAEKKSCKQCPYSDQPICRHRMFKDAIEYLERKDHGQAL